MFAIDDFRLPSAFFFWCDFGHLFRQALELPGHKTNRLVLVRGGSPRDAIQARTKIMNRRALKADPVRSKRVYDVVAASLLGQSLGVKADPIVGGELSGEAL